MLTKQGVALTFYAFFVASKTGKTGLTVTIDIYETTSGTPIVSAGSATALGGGLYYYTLSSGSVDAAGAYVAIFKTADTSVDQQHIPAIWITDTELKNLDAAVSSRNATTPLDSTATQAAAAAALTAYDAATGADVAGIPAAPDAATVADAVASVDPSVYGVGTAGYAWAAAGSAADPLLNPVPGAYVEPQAGYYIGRLANNEIDLVQVFNPTTMALSYYFGDDYAVEENRQQDFTTLLDLTGGSVNWRVKTGGGVVVVACSIEDANTYRLKPTATDLAAIGVGAWRYDLEMTLANGHVVTEVSGTVTVAQDVR